MLAMYVTPWHATAEKDDVGDFGKDDRHLTAYLMQLIYAASGMVRIRLAQASSYPATDHLAPRQMLPFSLFQAPTRSLSKTQLYFS